MHSQSNIWWIVPLVVIVLGFLIVQGRASRVARAGKAIAFEVAPAIRRGFIFGLVMIIILAIRSFGSSPTWLRILTVVLVLSGCIAWPATFICTEAALVKIIWWRRRVTIPWGEIVQLERTPGDDLNIYVASGQSLCFTRYHVGRYRFQAEIMQRARLRGKPLTGDSKNRQQKAA